MVDNLGEVPISEADTQALGAKEEGKGGLLPGTVLEHDQETSTVFELLRRQLEPLVAEAILEIEEERGVRGDKPLSEHRSGTCIFNDVIAVGLKEEGLEVKTAFSGDTGRLADGTFSSEVMHQHGILVSPVLNHPGKVVAIDVSCAQYAPLNAFLDREVLITILKEEDLEGALQEIYGGGSWQTEVL